MSTGYRPDRRSVGVVWLSCVPREAGTVIGRRRVQGLGRDGRNSGVVVGSLAGNCLGGRMVWTTVEGGENWCQSEICQPGSSGDIVCCTGSPTTVLHLFQRRCCLFVTNRTGRGHGAYMGNG